MDLNFEIFMVVLLVLSIVVVGNFLRDGESNYLEGALLVVSSTLFTLNYEQVNTDTVTDYLCYYRSGIMVLPEPGRCHFQWL